MPGYHLIELCCGSAALTLNSIGATKAVLPYHGSKWRVRGPLSFLLTKRGYGRPTSIQLNDIGPWGRTWGALIDETKLVRVIDLLKLMATQPPRIVYDELKGHRVPDDDVLYAAQYLFLQRISVNGKAVGTRDGRWKPPGYNKNSAEGCAKTPRFGGVRPMVPYLIEVLEEMRMLDWPEVSVSQLDARSVGLDRPRENLVVYIDPDYASLTGYPDGALPRHEVEQLALYWHGRGAYVLVSEAEQLQGLIELGWKGHCIEIGKKHTSPFKTKHSEWVTASP